MLLFTFQTPEILKSLEAMQTREVQSILIEHESLNVIIRFVEISHTFLFLGSAVLQCSSYGGAL